MSHKTTQAVLQLDKTPHAAEAALLSAFQEADSESGAAVKAAREAGISWPNIIALLLQFGPQFASLIAALLAGLNTNKAELERLAAMDKKAEAEKAVEKPVEEEEKHHGKKHG